MSETAPRVALYVHVPFCQARCDYCDFNTYAGLEDLIPPYVAAVGWEMESAARQWERLRIPTIYFGGGTPSTLPLELLARLLRISRRVFDLSPEAEISLEANPGVVTPQYLRGLRRIGVNRLSLGMQSTCDEALQLLGRNHTSAQAVETVTWAREAGFANLNLDLIFGLPGQTLAHWRETLQAALELEPEHLSLYSLGIERETPLANRIERGDLPAPDEDLAAGMYELAEEILARAGFFHYEISNWARAGGLSPGANSAAPRWWPRRETGDRSEDISSYVCRHNLIYWRNEPWLGVGAGAYSWLGGRRWGNVDHPREYTAALAQGDAPVAQSEEIDQPVEMGETMMLGLRLAEGVSEACFRARFGVGLESAFGEEIGSLHDLGLVEWDGRVVRLTARGRLLGNRVFARFV